MAAARACIFPQDAARQVEGKADLGASEPAARDLRVSAARGESHESKVMEVKSWKRRRAGWRCQSCNPDVPQRVRPHYEHAPYHERGPFVPAGVACRAF